jgi:hypothetical protein
VEQKNIFSKVKLNIYYEASGLLFNVEYWVSKNWGVGCGNVEDLNIYMCGMSTLVRKKILLLITQQNDMSTKISRCVTSMISLSGLLRSLQ